MITINEKDHAELVRLAKSGEWAERHCKAIIEALERCLSDLPVSRISSFERALDQAPESLKR